MRIEPTPRGLTATFFRQKYKFFLVALLVLAGGMALIHLTTPIYKSSGSMLVRFGDDARPSISLNGQAERGITDDDRQAMMQSFVQILQSHDLLLPVVKQFGGTRLYPSLAKHVEGAGIADEDAVMWLIKNDLIVKAEPGSNVIQISILNADPQLAQQCARRLIQVFVDRQSEVFNKPQTEFLSEQMKHAATDLQQQQQQLETFKARTGMTSIESELEQLMEEKSDVQNSAMDSVKEAQAKVDQLKSKEADLLATYQPNSFAVRNMQKTVSVAEGQLYARQQDLKAATLASTHNPSTVVTDANRPVSSSSSPLVSHMQDIDKRIAELEAQRTQFNDLSMQVQISEKTYKAFKDQLEQARMSDTLNQEKITRISVLDEPGLPVVPMHPNKPFIAILTCFAAILLASGVAVTSETLDQRFTTPWQVSTLLQVPVLASFTVSRKRTPHGSHA